MLSKTHTKYIQSLQHKKFRDEHHAFIAEGPKIVSELLENGYFICRELIALPEWLQRNEKLRSSLPDTRFTEVKDFELEKISALATPHSVLGVFDTFPSRYFMVPAGKITLLLDTIQDPGNLGTIIRIADWFGIENIICSKESVDMYNPKVVQSTMGSLGRMNIVYQELRGWLLEYPHIKTYAAALDGKHVTELGKLEEGIIIIGNESKGISDEIMELVNEKITIPRIGKAESLNAAVATGIILSCVL